MIALSLPQVSMDLLGRGVLDGWLIMVCGSVCKDFSSMGKGEGLTGQWVFLTAIMISLCITLQPTILFHECTSRFPFHVFSELLGTNFKDHHCVLTPVSFGAPVQRTRSYDAIVA